MKQTFFLIWLMCGALLSAASGAPLVSQAAGGFFYSLFLKSDGSLWAMGNNNAGQLGDGTYNPTNSPELITNSVTGIAAGQFHSLFLKSDGSLWAMGNNQDGQLGDGSTNNVNRPEQILPNNVTAVAAGWFHSLLIKTNGSLWAMGYNFFGQLGDGTYNTNTRPEQIMASNVTAIAAGYEHSLFLKSDGSLWAMGDNNKGQLGDGTYNSTNRPELIVSNNVAAIAAGYFHSLFLKNDGSLWAMGDNSDGQLGDSSNNNNTNRPEQILASNVTAIATEYYHSLILKSDGSLWAMGFNNHGQLGDGSYNNVSTPEKIMTNNVIALAAGGQHSLFAENDGSLWAMGYDYYGELGNGAFMMNIPYGTNVPVPILQPALAPPPPVIVTQPASQTNYFGATATFFVNATNVLPISYQWLKNGNSLIDGGNVSGSATNRLTLSTISDADAATYSVIASNANGSATSSNAVLTVNDLPFIAVQPLSQSVGVGSNVTFSAVGYGAPPLVFQWKFNNSPVGSPTTGTNVSTYTLTNVQTNQAGNYSVQLFGQSSATSSNALLTVLVFPPVILLQPTNQSAWLGSNASFSVAVGGSPPFSYQWQFNSTNLPAATNIGFTIPFVTMTNVGNYSVVVSNSAGGVTSSNAALTVIFPPTMGLQLLAGYPLLNLNGMLSRNFVVQYNTNLTTTNWFYLRSISNLASSPFQFLDPAGSSPPARFYRALMQ